MKDNKPTKKPISPIIIAAALASVIVVVIMIGILSTKKHSKIPRTTKDTFIEDYSSKLQQNQRDTQRKNEALRTAAAFNDYRATNRGRYPRTDEEFEIFKERFAPNLDLGLEIDFSDDTTKTPSTDKINIITNSQCDSDNKVVRGKGFTATVGLESGKQYCLDV